MNRSESRAGQHRGHRLRTHRHVDDDPVTFFDAISLENICELADFAVQLLIGKRHFIPGLAFPDQRRLVPSRTGKMPVEAVLGDIQFASDEPLRKRLLPFQNGFPLLLPHEKFGGLFRKEFLRILDRSSIKVLGIARNSRCAPVSRKTSPV